LAEQTTGLQVCIQSRAQMSVHIIFITTNMEKPPRASPMPQNPGTELSKTNLGESTEKRDYSNGN
jgi:hypothetical protein